MYSRGIHAIISRGGVRTISTAIYIPSIDAKDLWLANYNRQPYSLLNAKGEPNYRRYINTLDYSLDQIKLRELYPKVYRRHDFTRWHGGKEYTARVINVTFKYAVCEWNRCWRGAEVYVRYDVYDRGFELTDGVFIRDGRLAAIAINTPVECPLPDYELPECFAFEDGCYKLVKQPRKLKSVAQLREDLYERGFTCEDVKYRRWKRSSGSSRVGKCLFIDEGLFTRMHKWEMCGLHVEEGDPVDLAALESYISLTSSSIISTLHLEPKNILVISDWKSEFEDDVISVYEQNGRIAAKPVKQKIVNNIFDGQGLLDSSLFTGMLEGKGMALLRNLFFKSCCFNCNIQKWFADNGITSVEQLNGETLAEDISDIKLITTPSSIKYLKFGKLKEWLNRIETEFGVVKTDKPSHIMDGRMVQTHYQLINTLQLTKEEVGLFLKPTFDYMTAVKTRPSVLKYHVKYAFPKVFDDNPAFTPSDVVFRLLSVNETFCKTKLYADFRDDLLKSLTKRLRLGKVWVNGTYATLLGNPVEMLRHAIGKFLGETSLPVGCVHTIRFADGVRLLGSRSPHVSMSNVWVPRNNRLKEIDNYFNLTPEILCINSIGENILNTLSGCDFDGDAVLLTDNAILIEAALRNVGRFRVAVADIPSLKSRRKYTPSDQADLDIKTSNNLIGDIINLSQELNTLIWDKLNRGACFDDVSDTYNDVCILNVMSGIEIDKAKKEVLINNSRELSTLRAKYYTEEQGRAVKPNFFAAKDRGKGYYDSSRKLYKKHLTPMDYAQECINVYRQQRVGVKRRVASKKPGMLPPWPGRSKEVYMPFSDMVIADGYAPSRVNQKIVAEILRDIDDTTMEVRSIGRDSSLTQSQQWKHMREVRSRMLERLGKLKMTRNTVIHLLKIIETPEMSRYASRLLTTLFSFPNECFYNALKRSIEPIEVCEEGEPCEMNLYDIPVRFSRIRVEST